MTLTLAVILIAIVAYAADHVIGQRAILGRSCGAGDPVLLRRWGRSVIVRRVA